MTEVKRNSKNAPMIKPRWVKGQSGNPGGKPKGFKEFRELCRTHAPDAMMRLVSIARGEPQEKLATHVTKGGAVREKIIRETPPLRFQMEAAQTIVERAYGKAVQPIAGEEGEGPVKVTSVKEIVVRVRDDLVDDNGRARMIEHDPNERRRS